MQIQTNALEALEECKRILAKDGVALPSDSWLTGQAFASMAAGKKVVVNDIDVFKIIPRNLFDDRKMIEKTEKIIDVTGDNYNSWIGETVETKYKVEATTNIGLMNLTNISFQAEHEREFYGIDLVNLFDINSTQCAINTTTLEVVYTDAFKSYVETNRLEITNLSTVGHSLIRLVKKAKELEAECNFEKEFDKFIGSRAQFTPWIGEKLYSKYLENKEVFDNYGVMFEETFFEGRKHRLFKAERFFSPLNSWCLKIYNLLISNFRDIVKLSNVMYGLNMLSVVDKLKYLNTVADFEKEQNKKIHVEEASFANKFFADKDFSGEVISELYEAFDGDVYSQAVVYNSSSSIKEALEWVDIVKNPRAKKAIEEVFPQATTKEHILSNLVGKTPSEIIESMPNFDESSDLKVYASHGDVLIVEAEQIDEKSFELFGYKVSNEIWKTITLDANVIYDLTLYENEDIHLLQTEEGMSLSDADKAKIDSDVFNHHSYEETVEIPF